MYYKVKKHKINEFELGVFDQFQNYVPSLFDDMLFEDGFRKSDIFYLFNQQRLDNLISSEKIDKYLSRLYEVHPDSPFKNSTDEQIIQSIVSRRISNFNDLYNYSKHLSNRSKSLEDDLLTSFEHDSYLKNRKSEQERYKKIYDKLNKNIGNE